jgi:thiol-disulfide isomerase/thioredoxin
MRFVLFFVLLMPACVLASADTDWSAIVAMDAGPRRKPDNREDAKLIAHQHLLETKRMLGDFLAKYPEGLHSFDARMRLAAVLAAIGKMDGTQQPVDDAMRMLAQLERASGVALEKRADAGFQRVALYFQSMRGREVEMRGAIVDSARGFVASYPADRRGPRLLVEAATICDSDPGMKRRLLEDAWALSRDEALNRRIADDLMRLGLLDKRFDFKFQTVQGKSFDVASLHGSVVVIVFWSAESPHCLIWLPEFVRAMRRIASPRLVVATVAADTNRAEVERRLKEFGIGDWPTGFDGKGWESPLVRSLGINALPTVFVVSKSGQLASLNARDNYDLVIRRLLRE